MHQRIYSDFQSLFFCVIALFAMSCQLIVPELTVVADDSQDTGTEPGDTATDTDNPVDTETATATDTDNPVDTETDTATGTDSPVDTETDTATDSDTVIEADPNVLMLHFEDSDFSMEASVFDASAYAHHATVKNAALDALVGDTGSNYLSMDGVGWLEIADRPALRPGAELTVSLWVYPINMADNFFPGLVVKRRGYSDLTAYAVYLHNYQVAVDIDYETDRAYSTQILNNLEWYHVAVVFDGNLLEDERVTIYINGVVDSVHSETSSTIGLYTSDITIGNLVNGGQIFAGGIDEVGIWHRALSAQEIAALSVL